MRKNIGAISNYLAGLIILIMGLIYLFKNSFMPYHRDAVSMQWSELSMGTQFLILALMRATAGGYLAVAVMIIVLQRRFSKTPSKWIPIVILIPGFIISLTSIYATLLVRFNSPGKPPTLLAIFGIVLLLIGYINNKSQSLRPLK
ncbi:MAG: hypothetical protein ACPHVX_06770 [Flavobacteriaceae bacterium]